jgi:hypothetical protein
VPQWWPPEAASRFRLTAPIVATGEAKGAFVHVGLAFDRAAYCLPRIVQPSMLCLHVVPPPHCSPSIIRAARSTPTMSISRSRLGPFLSL